MPYKQQNRSGRPNRSRNVQPRPQTKRRQPKKAYINPERFIQSAKPQVNEVFVPTHRFPDFALDARIQRNLAQMGYTDPSPIQDQTIPHGLAGRDVVGIANTGTGKTAAFAIPVLNRLISQPGSKAIVLAPTRELAQQIEEQFHRIGKDCGIHTVLLIGGAAMGPQLKSLQRGPRVVIGTPGRIKDHLERGSLFISRFNMVVLDEVDRMLDMGFVHDIRRILEQIKTTPQSFYFSATLDERVKGIINSFSENPVHISVKSGETSDTIEQNVVTYTPQENNKLETLHDVLIDRNIAKAIIFDDTKYSVERLSKKLEARGFSAGSIHGGKTQSQRQRVLNKFKANEINILVATDVAARGLDVKDVTHVINYSLPQSYDDYVHRIGRAGRAGRTGHALTFVEK